MSEKIATEKKTRAIRSIHVISPRGILPTTFPIPEWAILEKRNPAAAQFNVPWIVSFEEEARGILVTYEIQDKVTKEPVTCQSLVPWANLAEVRYAPQA